MALSELTLTSLPVLVSMVLSAAIVYILVQCVCSKRPADKDPELTSVTSKDKSTVLPPEGDLQQLGFQSTTQEANGKHLETETAITPLNTSKNTQNGSLHNNLQHSRGNSVDLNKTDRHSGASTGSSPRPNAISRELPDIPHNSRGTASTLDGHHRGGHSHSQLPELPNTANLSSSQESSGRGGNLSHTSSPTGSRSTFSSPEKTAVLRANTTTETSPLDDYDHIEEKTKPKKTRPRSDYDHVVLEGNSKRIVPAKQKLEDNDYAEVKTENIYEGVPDDVNDVMVIPVSKPTSITIHVGRSPKKEVKKINSVDDPYNKIQVDDPPYNRIKDDPYNRIRDRDDTNPYNSVRGDADLDDLDPYNTVRDTDSTGTRSSVSQTRNKTPTNFKPDLYDPYATAADDDRNVSNQTDPYCRVGDTEIEIDDPYNKVIEDSDSAINSNTAIPDYTDADYATVNKAGEVEYAKVNKQSVRDRQRNSGAVSDLDTINVNSQIGASGTIPSSPREEIIQDEYATVVKIKRLSPGNTTDSETTLPHARASGSSVIPSSRATKTDQATSAGGTGLGSEVRTPPEPPRGYSLNTSPDGDHYNTMAAVAAVPGIDSSLSDQEHIPVEKKKEPPYNKLSVRESLASMNARIASNAYEYVSEVSDNLYATVEGSSGDGMVRPKLTSTTEGRESVISEHYAEIDAPAPPSLDSLHETAKHHQVETRRKDSRPGDLEYYNIDESSQGNQVKGHNRTQSGQSHTSQGHHMTSSGQGNAMVQGHFRTPSGDAMTSSFEGRATLAMEENVDLDIDPNYQSVQEVQILDMNSEFDPNYETVEEAKSKAKYEEINGARAKEPTIRNHIYEEADSKRKYEEIKGASNTEEVKIRAHVYEEVTITNEGRRARQLVLNQHTYEEVTEVKGQNQGQKSVKVQGQSLSDVPKLKKGHERTSSGDQSKAGKRKSGEIKDKKDKDKRKLDGKENRKSGEMGKR